MYLGSIRTSIVVPGLGIRLSLADLRDALCRRLFGRNCDCSLLEPYLANPNMLGDKIADMLASMIEAALPGVDCSRKNPAELIVSALNIGFGTDGVTVDINVAGLAQQALCVMARQGVKASNLLNAPARLIADELRKLCPAPNSTGVVVNGNTYALQNPNTPPVYTRDTGVTTYATPTAYVPPQMKKKTGVKPAVFLVAGGVALVASTMILFRKR